MNNNSISSKYYHHERYHKSPSLLNSKSFGRVGSSKLSTSSSHFSGKKSAVRAQIDELLKCIICFGRVINPQMCPSCSNLCCYSCIKRWLTEQKSQCPHCRRSLRVSQLINCKLVTDIAIAVDEFGTQKKEPAKSNDQCSEHNSEYYYYCKNCNTPLCTDCAMFGKDHKGHELQHISKVYEHQVELIKTEEKALKGRINSLIGNLSGVEANIQKITDMKEEKYNELETIVEQMSERLESEFKSRLLELLAQKTSVTDEIEFLKLMESEIEKQLTHPAKNKLVLKVRELLKMLQEIASRPFPPLHKNLAQLEFKSEVMPSFTCGTFVLKQYSTLRRLNDVVYSEPLSEYGLSWRLKVYPNGNGYAKGMYISVFLEMAKGYEDPMNYEYKVEMVNQRDSEVVLKRESTSEFENGKCWGHTRFFKIDLLEKEGYLIPQKDMLVFKFYVRSPTYNHHSQDQQRYIAILEEEHKRSNAIVNELKEKIKEERLNSERLKTSAKPTLTMLSEIKTEENGKNKDRVTSQKREEFVDIETRREGEEQKQDGVDRKLSVSTEYEDVEEEEDHKMFWSKSKGEFKSTKTLSKDQDSEKQDDELLQEKYERTSSSDIREDSKYEELFNQEDWLETKKVNLYCQKIDDFLKHQLDNHDERSNDTDSRGFLEDNLHSSSRHKDESSQDFASSRKTDQDEKSSDDNPESLRPIDVEVMFQQKLEEERRLQEQQERSHSQKSRKHKDLEFLQLPDKVIKKLDSLKFTELFKISSLQNSDLNQNLGNTSLDKSSLKSRADKLRGNFTEFDKENIQANESQSAL